MSYMPSFRRDRQTDKTTGEELTFDYVVHRLGEVDFADAVRRLGFIPTKDGAADDEIEIDFLGQRYRLSKKGGVFSCDTVSGRAVRLNFRSIVCYYALSKARGEPLEDFCLIDRFSHGVFSSTREDISGMGRMTLALRTVLEGCAPEEQVTRFAAGVEWLGMRPLDGDKGAAHKWAYDVFPKVPTRVVFYEADDEFPPDLRIYWDKTAIQVFDFEPLAVLQGCFVHVLTESCACRS
ncbi:MAG: DUF3786 domain-containing protein [Spirochaetaceae bacterium]|jgi:hypothetical protein|nr:DUF3786 domain-containing protein [Spirochaetaceae bacterium]